MKLIKSVGLATCMALAAMAFVGAASVAAEFHVESCDAGGCKASSVGTEFTAYTTEVTLTNPGLAIINTCEGELEGTVLKTLATATEEIDADINNAAFFNCERAEPILVFGLPWLLTTSLSLFTEDQMGLVSGGVLVQLASMPLIGKCTYTETTKDVVFGDWENGEPSTVVLLGSLERENSHMLCGLVNISGSLEVTSVSDPNLPAANNLQIL